MKELVLLLLLSHFAMAADPGKEAIGEMEVTLLFATNGDPSQGGKRAKAVPDREVAEIKRMRDLNFRHFRFLGRDRQPIFRSYENWAAPLRPSKRILVSFEPAQRIGRDRLRVDLAYWQGKQKMLKIEPVLRVKKPLYLLGPSWRGGRLLLKFRINRLNP